jgi:hypothetical protein
MRKEIWWVAGILIAAGLGGAYYYWRQNSDKGVAPPVPIERPVPEPAIRHPLPGAQTSAQPLPALQESDGAVLEALGAQFGKEPVSQFLRPDGIIRRIVVTVDNLPRKKVAVELRPVNPAPGTLLVTSTSAALASEQIILSARNYARYKPFVELIKAADTRKTAALYLHFYPLFQQAYEDLGYPGKYFNDRLVEAIDHLLDTPEVPGPVKLLQPNVFYEFADPMLEARSAGQKLLIRMGSENAVVIKEKLRELRKEIATDAAPSRR